MKDWGTHECAWLNFFNKLQITLQSLALIGEPYSREADHLGRAEPLAHATLLRVISSSRAITLLLADKLLVDATSLARGLAEAELFMRALLIDFDKTLHDLNDDYFAGRVGHAKVVKEISEARASDRQYAAQVVKDSDVTKLLKWNELAKRIGDQRPYAVFRKFSGNSAHISVGSLERHIQLTEDSALWSGYINQPYTSREAGDLLFECSRAIIKIGEAYVALLAISEEVVDWSSVVENFNAGVLPHEEIGANA